MNLINTTQCKCKKEHTFNSEIIVGKGAINQIPRAVKKFDAKKAYVIAHQNTFSAAGEKVCKLHEENNLNVKKYIFKKIKYVQHFLYIKQ